METEQIKVRNMLAKVYDEGIMKKSSWTALKMSGILLVIYRRKGTQEHTQVSMTQLELPEENQALQKAKIIEMA